MEYNNAVLTLTPHSTPDPFCVHANGYFYLTYTTGDHIQIWRSQDLPGFMNTGHKIIVFRPPPNSDHSSGIWAPELHAINGRWYILYCAEDAKIGNASHRLFLLGGPPANEDPCADASTGAWQDLGHIQGMDVNQWAIDGTFFTLNNQLFMAYSGSPPGANLSNFTDAEINIVPMQNPNCAVAGRAVRISSPTNSWERSGHQGVNEGPQWLEAPDGSWKGLVISGAGSWTQDYKMLILHYNGGDPLNPRSWHKDNNPLAISGRGSRGPFGPGHGNFVNIGNETLAVFHATDGPTDGWENRKARLQRVAWTRQGPSMGGRVGSVVPTIEAFQAGPSSVPRSPRSTRERLGSIKTKYKYYTSGW